MEYEYGILHYKEINTESDLEYLVDDDLHRLDMTKDEAALWVDEWVQMGGRREAFILVRRPKGGWEIVK